MKWFIYLFVSGSNPHTLHRSKSHSRNGEPQALFSMPSLDTPLKKKPSASRTCKRIPWTSYQQIHFMKPLFDSDLARCIPFIYTSTSVSTAPYDSSHPSSYKEHPAHNAGSRGSQTYTIKCWVALEHFWKEAHELVYSFKGCVGVRSRVWPLHTKPVSSLPCTLEPSSNHQPIWTLCNQTSWYLTDMSPDKIWLSLLQQHRDFFLDRVWHKRKYETISHSRPW